MNVDLGNKECRRRNKERYRRVIENNARLKTLKKGGAKKDIIDIVGSIIGDLAYNYYKRVAGETEARNVAEGKVNT